MPENGVQPQPTPEGSPEPTASATEHIGEAHQLLTRLRERIQQHPELDAAIERLELALADLNLRTGGML